ncbi:MAG: hypothetical protein JWR40_5159 [Massilia sp.]|nr:hypothetical protein [Massilia sp.]
MGRLVTNELIAAPRSRPSALDGFGIVGGNIQTQDEYAELNSVAPRPHPLTRMMIDVNAINSDCRHRHWGQAGRTVDKSMNIHRYGLWINTNLCTSQFLSRFDASPIQSR